jgi:hypothetical protein
MTSLSKVQWLTVAEIAQLWAEELKVPSSTIEREIRIALLKLEKHYPFHQDIDFQPKEEELPTRDTMVERGFVIEFSGKQYWKLPSFWFTDPPKGPSFPGRPSVMNAIVHKLQQIAETEQLKPSLAEQEGIWNHGSTRSFPTSIRQKPRLSKMESGLLTTC